ncbi:hypothetical protein EBR78_03675 [bacterium]|nr:hypothetical protein [bacterium]
MNHLRFLISITFLSVVGFAGPGDHQDLKNRAKVGGSRPEAQTEQAALLVEVPEDIKTLDELRKWLKRFSEKEVILKMGASWCRPCAELHPEMEALAHKKQGSLKVVTLDIDNNPALANALAPGSKVPALIRIKNDGVSAPEAPLVGYMKGRSSPISNWLKSQ